MPLSPRIEVLYAVMQRLIDADLPTSTGHAALKLRWARNRYTARDERPCLAVAFVSDEPVEGEGSNLNPDELVRALAFDLIVDLEIETESSAEANAALATPIGDFDPSGLQELSQVLDQAMKALRETMIDPLRDTTGLGKVSDWVQDVSIDDDDELPDDDGRLVGRANVIYRVSSWDPTLLFKRE